VVDATDVGRHRLWPTPQYLCLGSVITIVLTNLDGQIAIWDIHLEQRAADEIQRLVTARSPWTLTDGVLLPHDR
jgi:hypothetical protein